MHVYIVFYVFPELIHPYSSLFVLIHPYSSLFVLIRPYSSLSVLIHDDGNDSSNVDDGNDGSNTDNNDKLLLSTRQ